MTKLFWGAKYSSISPLIGDISIATDNPVVTPFVSLSHEIAHKKLGHHKILGNVSAEVDAWELTIFQLMQGGEWKEAIKAEAIYALNSYIGNYDEAKWWIERLEQRAKRELDYIKE